VPDASPADGVSLHHSWRTTDAALSFAGASVQCSCPAFRTYSTSIPKWCVSTWYARQQTTPHGGASSVLTTASITLYREHYHILQNSFQITCVIPTESVQGHKVRKHVRKYIPRGKNEWEPGTKSNKSGLSITSPRSSLAQPHSGPLGEW
jgi:hypothetical protein